MNRQMTQQQRKSYPFNRSPEEAPTATSFLKFTGPDKNYDTRGFVAQMRQLGVTPGRVPSRGVNPEARLP
jgi:hypothetical protein